MGLGVAVGGIGVLVGVMVAVAVDVAVIMTVLVTVGVGGRISMPVCSRQAETKANKIIIMNDLDILVFKGICMVFIVVH